MGTSAREDMLKESDVRNRGDGAATHAEVAHRCLRSIRGIWLGTWFLRIVNNFDEIWKKIGQNVPSIYAEVVIPPNPQNTLK